MTDILRGTTPDFILHIKESDFSVTEVEKLEITIWSGVITTIYGLDDVTVDAVNNSFSIRFTERQTLALHPDKSFRWQMRARLLDKTIVGTKESEPIAVEPLKSTEVMSG